MVNKNKLTIYHIYRQLHYVYIQFDSFDVIIFVVKSEYLFYTFNIVCFQEADMAVGDFSVTNKRIQVVDNLFPYANDPVSFMVARPEVDYLSTYLRPFVNALWILLSVTVLGIGVLLWLFSQRNRMLISFVDNIFTSIGMLFQEGS